MQLMMTMMPSLAAMVPTSNAGTVMRLVILQGTARSRGPYVDGFRVSGSWTANDNSFDVIGTMLDNGG
jgi:hypothetical protein